MSRAAAGLAMLLAVAAGAAHAAGTGDALPLEPARQVSIDTREGTWLSPDLSPDGSTIVFELLGDLFTVDAHAGGEAHALTSGLAFDSQPVFSPDGHDIAFVSDRSGAENLWIVAADGSHLRQLTKLDDNAVFTSPAWSADGKAIFVSHYRAEYNGFELWQVDVASGATTMLSQIKKDADTPRDQMVSVLGAIPSADGKSLFFARHVGDNAFDKLPEWTIVRRDLASGHEQVLVWAARSPRPDLVLGTAFRPAVSHDGQFLVYGTRDRGRTGLRLLNLKTLEDHWLRYPVQQDDLQASGWRDLLPRYEFTPDDRALIANDHGKIVRIDRLSGAETEIPFHVKEQLPIGPATRQNVRQETGPVRLRIIQTPVASPDGRWLAFSALGAIYRMRLDGQSHPVRLTDGFQPAWSPDGTRLTFVRWTAREAGQVWQIAADGGEAQQVTDIAAYYTTPVYTPDGREIVALRSSNEQRMHSYMEYGSLRQCELVRLHVPPPQPGSPSATPAANPARVVMEGRMGGTPHFGPDAREVYLTFGDGVHRVALDGSGDHLVVAVTGPNWYFAEGRAQADDVRVSPDGQWVLAQIAQQLHLLKISQPGQSLDIDDAGLVHRKLTARGADFFGWADHGRTITWALGSHFYRLPLAAAGTAHPKSFAADIELPRAVNRGSLLLRGATVISERGDEVIRDADLLVRDDRIAALGPRGTLSVPANATIRDVSGKWIVPGFIDSHDHIADIRRGVLDFDAWGPLANLAYGVTTAFDPSTLSIDMLAYQDAIDTGKMLGSRIASTGPALFSFNEFRSYDEVRAVLSRYRDDYRLGNIKMYRSGNRRVRQWIAMAAGELGLQPTCEGALSMKLDMSQIIDGYAGNEHALTVPLYADMIALMVQSGVGWTATLQITNGGPEGQDYFIVRDHPAEDPKLNRFAPRFVVDMKTRTRTWRELGEYHFPRVAAAAAAVQRAGGLIGIGAHGEMPGLGWHWEVEAHTMGGMTPAEALHAGTIGSAAHIGRAAEFGSLEPGKYADLVILDRDPLQDIANTLAIDAVMEGGVLRDGHTLDEVWPEPRPLPRRWYCDDRPPGTPDPCAAMARTR